MNRIKLAQPPTAINAANNLLRPLPELIGMAEGGRDE
jgi:hypothetical protein